MDKWVVSIDTIDDVVAHPYGVYSATFPPVKLIEVFETKEESVEFAKFYGLLTGRRYMTFTERNRFHDFGNGT